MTRTASLAALVVLGLALPLLGKPVHVDDTNFLVLARAAAAHPWTPHEAVVNWQGTAQRAFDVLSNPPGIGWWLAPVADAPVELQHLWMLPWLVPAVWGAWQLGSRLAGRGAAAVLLLCGSPVAVLAAQALTPDLPLLACSLAGLAGVVAGRRRWALVAGCAALFRYSGGALIPVAALWPLLTRRGWREAAQVGALASLPIGLLALHDLAAYGQVHLLAMTGFQGVADTPREVFRKLVAAVAMLGGAAALPLLCWARPGGAALGALAGLGLGWSAATLSAQHGPAAWATLAFAAAGGAVLGGAVAAGLRRGRQAAWLLAWLALGLLFLLRLRFAAARYWLPFFAPAVLLVLREARPWKVVAACLLTPALALALAVDDLHLARAQESLARQVSALGTGLFAGHWGWQHHLEASGWTALDEDAPVPAGTLFAVSLGAWPQEPARGCLAPVARFEAPDRWPGPRVHTARGAANIHAYLVSARPPVETYAPWTFARDPLDVVTVWRGCR